MNEFISAFKQSLKKLDIKNGDVVYVASDATLLLSEARKKLDVKSSQQRDEFLNQVVDVLKECVGDNGTLLFPVFTWDFCRGKDFDIASTKGETGALSNWVLAKRSDFKRTQHPIYSFMVWGKDSELLVNMTNKDSWGKESPFYYLHKQQAKLLLLNVSLQRGFTFMHYVEQSIKVPYRYHKEFKSSYIDENGNLSERIYSMYVRDLAIESKEHLPEEFLDSRGITKVSNLDKLTLRIVDLNKAYDIVAADYLHNQGKNCYIFTNYEIDWTKGQTHNDQISN